MEINAGQVSNDILAVLDRVKCLVGNAADAAGLTRVQVFCLIVLHRHGRLAMGEAANVLHCDASNVTGLVDRLVARKLVTRAESEHDRRTKTMQLTDAGKQLVSGMLAALPSQLGCAKLTSSECATLHTLLNKILAPAS